MGLVVSERPDVQESFCTIRANPYPCPAAGTPSLQGGLKAGKHSWDSGSGASKGLRLRKMLLLLLRFWWNVFGEDEVAGGGDDDDDVDVVLESWPLKILQGLRGFVAFEPCLVGFSELGCRSSRERYYWRFPSLQAASS